MIGAQGDLQIWWTPHLPLIYISNPKSGCTTIKHSLKEAQACLYVRSGSVYERAASPHRSDDCLKRDWLSPAACRSRYVISCVRNPFTRALSGYLDKIDPQDAKSFRELKRRRGGSFEDYLTALRDYPRRDTNPHFRAQHFNLDYPRVKYDAIFFLEDLAPLPQFLKRLAPRFKVETHADHARSAAAKLQQYYSPRTLDLVREIYALDFSFFGYSHDLADALDAPGAMVAGGRLLQQPFDADSSLPMQAGGNSAFESMLRFRRIVDLRIL